MPPGRTQPRIFEPYTLLPKKHTRKLIFGQTGGSHRAMPAWCHLSTCPQRGSQLSCFNCLDLYHTSTDSSAQIADLKKRFDPALRAGDCAHPARFGQEWCEPRGRGLQRGGQASRAKREQLAGFKGFGMKAKARITPQTPMARGRSFKSAR